MEINERSCNVTSMLINGAIVKDIEEVFVELTGVHPSKADSNYAVQHHCVYDCGSLKSGDSKIDTSFVTNLNINNKKIEFVVKNWIVENTTHGIDCCCISVSVLNDSGFILNSVNIEMSIRASNTTEKNIKLVSRFIKPIISSLYDYVI